MQTLEYKIRGDCVFKKNKILLVILSLCMLSILVACSSQNKDSAYAESTQNLEEAKEETGIIADEAISAQEGIQFDTSSQLNRKVIKTGRIDLQTKAFDNTVQGIMDHINEIGGFVQNCSIEGNNLYREYNQRYANLSVRIPNKEFDKFMNESNQFGNVTSKSIQGEDVTDQYMDTEIRLETLEIQAERLKELLKQAGDLDKLFKIEKELASVTYEIEALKGNLKKYDSLIDYSTIEINVEEAETYVEPAKKVTFLDRIKNTFMDSVDELINLLQGFVLIIVALIPFLIIVAPIVLIIAWIIIRNNRKKKEK